MKWADGGAGPKLELSHHRYYGIPVFGYLRWRDYVGDSESVAYVHQLAFLAHHQDIPPSLVFSNGEFVIHHGADERFSGMEGKCPLFNWGENLVLEAQSDHADRHLNGAKA